MQTNVRKNLLKSRRKGDIFDLREFRTNVLKAGGKGMNNEEYKQSIIKMVQEIESNSFLKMIYTAVKTCYEKGKSQE